MRTKYVSTEELRLARQCDLLTYLETTRPQELVPLRNGVYCLRSHDSLKISNGKWFWWSRGIGGRSALDYLIECEGVPLVEAVQRINGMNGTAKEQPSRSITLTRFKLPARSTNNDRVFRYLQNRGIDKDVLDLCVAFDLLYEDTRHNCCFVGYDETHIPRYAMLRSSLPDSTFLQEAEGSDKRFSFSLPPTVSTTLYVTESAIDALSVYVLRKKKPDHYLSIAGANTPHGTDHLPLALSHYLSVHPQIETVCLCLDNDSAGIRAAQSIRSCLPARYKTELMIPKQGKDYNEQLMRSKGLQNRIATRKPKHEMEELTI